MRYLRVRNWKKYQHYKGRNLIFVKLYRDIVRSRVWFLLKDAEKASLIGILCIANEHGCVENDARMIQVCACLRRKPDLQKLLEVDFIELTASNDDSVASTELATCYPRYRKEKIEQEEEELASKVASKHSVSIEQFVELWNNHGSVKTKGFFPKRLDVIAKVLEEKPDLAYWETVFKTVASSAFLNSSEKKWKTTLDWVVLNHIKIIEGVFNDETLKDKRSFLSPIR